MIFSLANDVIGKWPLASSGRPKDKYRQFKSQSSKVGVCVEFLFLFHRTLTVVLFCLKITISHRTCFYGRFSFVKNVTCFPNFVLIAKNSSEIVSKFRDLQIGTWRKHHQGYQVSVNTISVVTISTSLLAEESCWDSSDF